MNWLVLIRFWLIVSELLNLAMRFATGETSYHKYNRNQCYCSKLYIDKQYCYLCTSEVIYQSKGIVKNTSVYIRISYIPKGSIWENGVEGVRYVYDFPLTLTPNTIYFTKIYFQGQTALWEVSGWSTAPISKMTTKSKISSTMVMVPKMQKQKKSP